MEDERIGRLPDEDPVEHQGVDVNAEMERPADSLDARHHARLAVEESLPCGFPTIRGAQRPDEGTEHRPTQGMIVGE